MTLNYYMMVERYPNLTKEVGGLIPGCEISSLLDMNLPSGQLPLVLWRWHVDLMSRKKIKVKWLKSSLSHAIEKHSDCTKQHT